MGVNGAPGLKNNCPNQFHIVIKDKNGNLPYSQQRHATVSSFMPKLIEVLRDLHAKCPLPTPKDAESHAEYKGLDTDHLAINQIQVNKGALKDFMSTDVKGVAALQPALTDMQNVSIHTIRDGVKFSWFGKNFN